MLQLLQKVILQVTLCGEFFVFLQQNERDNSSASGQPTTEQKAMPGVVNATWRKALTTDCSASRYAGLSAMNAHPETIY